MAPSHSMQLVDRDDWTLMTAVHDALRRDLDQLLYRTVWLPRYARTTSPL